MLTHVVHRQGLSESNGFVIILDDDAEVYGPSIQFSRLQVLSSSFRHMSLDGFAKKIEDAALSVSSIVPDLRTLILLLSQTIAQGKHITGDLGGKATTQEYTEAIIRNLA